MFTCTFFALRREKGRCRPGSQQERPGQCAPSHRARCGRNRSGLVQFRPSAATGLRSSGRDVGRHPLSPAAPRQLRRRPHLRATKRYMFYSRGEGKKTTKQNANCGEHCSPGRRRGRQRVLSELQMVCDREGQGRDVHTEAAEGLERCTSDPALHASCALRLSTQA